MYELSRLFHSPLFQHIHKYLSECPGDETIFLFVPYVKTSVLEKLLDGMDNKTVLVTTWEPKDILSGSSELGLYPFCKRNGIALYVSQCMHLKVYSIGMMSAILATGNISQRGMMQGGNYEAAAKIEHLGAEDRLYFHQIRKEARLVDDRMYGELKEWYDINKKDVPKPPSLSDIISEPERNDFSVASLPMTRSIDDLVLGYERVSNGLEPSDDPEVSACVFYDLANYVIKPGLSRNDFVNELAKRFFEHPFIRRIDEFISPEAYFGRIKEWIQNNCTDVPVPSRRELTGNVQVLLEWFVMLGGNMYVIDVPGRHSQRIRKISDQNTA